MNLDTFFELLDLELLTEVWSSTTVTIGFLDIGICFPVEEELDWGMSEGGLTGGQVASITGPWTDLSETVVVEVSFVP